MLAPAWLHTKLRHGTQKSTISIKLLVAMFHSTALRLLAEFCVDDLTFRVCIAGPYLDLRIPSALLCNSLAVKNMTVL